MPTTFFIASLQATVEPSTLETLARVADIVIAASVLILAVLGIMLFAKANVILNEIRRSTRQNFGPVSDRARSISDNVEYITQAVRTDVVGLHDSVQSLTARLNQASERMEERIEDFNALMEVVQGEAEEIFLDAASTARGVREGARTISHRVAGPDEEVESTDPEYGDADEGAGRLGGVAGRETRDSDATGA